MLPLLPTSLVGSYAQPDWLLDRSKLAKRFPPRVRAGELWRIDPQYLEEAQDDATRLAILDQERAGLDLLTHGDFHLDEDLAGRSWHHYPLQRWAGFEGDNTTHYSVVDRNGNAVSNTYTLNFSYGVGMVAGGRTSIDQANHSLTGRLDVARRPAPAP